MNNINIIKVLTTLVVVIGLITGIFTIDARYAKLSAVEKIEQQTVQSLEQFKKSLDVRYLYDRYNQLIDQKMRLKIMSVSRPNDTEIIELLEQVDESLKETKQKINTLNIE